MMAYCLHGNINGGHRTTRMFGSCIYTQPIRLLIVLQQWNAERPECMRGDRSRREA